MPWQKWFLAHALELSPTEFGEDGSPLFRFRKVILLVGRQNGKSTVMQALTLWRMFVDRSNLVIGTAQDLEVAESLWAEAVEMAEDVEDLASEIGDVVRGNGKKLLRLTTGESYKVKAASRRGGRGLSGELVLLDELREHQSWDAWAAVTKTTNARERAQIYAISNAGDASSIVLRYLRKMAHAALGDPDGINSGDEPTSLLPTDEADELDEMDVSDDALGIFEWSAPPNCEIADRDGWAMANPALGHRVREATLASDARTDPEWVFRTEVLCQWSDGSLEGPFPPGSWEAGVDSESKLPADANPSYCMDVSWDRSRSYIGVAGIREDGLPHAEVVAARAGTEWVIPWFSSRASETRPMTVVVQAKGAPASSMLDDLKAIEHLTVVEWGGSDLGAATGQIYDLVRITALPGGDRPGAGLRHLPQPVLDIAAATAIPKPLGDAYVWDRKRSPHDSAPLITVTGAVWHALQPPEEELPPADIF